MIQIQLLQYFPLYKGIVMFKYTWIYLTFIWNLTLLMTKTNLTNYQWFLFLPAGDQNVKTLKLTWDLSINITSSYQFKFIQNEYSKIYFLNRHSVYWICSLWLCSASSGHISCIQSCFLLFYTFRAFCTVNL